MVCEVFSFQVEYGQYFFPDIEFIIDPVFLWVLLDVLAFEQHGLALRIVALARRLLAHLCTFVDLV
jgi:hypothetical protein